MSTVTLSTLMFAAFFSLCITYLPSEWQCVPPDVYCSIGFLYVQLVEHCNDLRINAEFILA